MFKTVKINGICWTIPTQVVDAMQEMYHSSGQKRNDTAIELDGEINPPIENTTESLNNRSTANGIDNKDTQPAIRTGGFKRVAIDEQIKSNVLKALML